MLLIQEFSMLESSQIGHPTPPATRRAFLRCMGTTVLLAGALATGVFVQGCGGENGGQPNSVTNFFPNPTAATVTSSTGQTQRSVNVVAGPFSGNAAIPAPTFLSVPTAANPSFTIQTAQTATDIVFGVLVNGLQVPGAIHVSLTSAARSRAAGDPSYTINLQTSQTPPGMYAQYSTDGGNTYSPPGETGVTGGTP
jgi:hypothetical protein